MLKIPLTSDQDIHSKRGENDKKQVAVSIVLKLGHCPLHETFRFI